MDGDDAELHNTGLLGGIQNSEQSNAIIITIIIGIFVLI
jgi:hypothetical protein